ncbi:serine hydrolase [bacterium]|nr:serine hydrolase [bacterium]
MENSMEIVTFALKLAEFSQQQFRKVVDVGWDLINRCQRSLRVILIPPIIDANLENDAPVSNAPAMFTVPCCTAAPKSVFGHTGYTGTCCWVDPENKLIYVFLSNRTYPVDGENKLAKMSIRPKIQQVIYNNIQN